MAAGRRRYLEATAFVGTWMLLGVALDAIWGKLGTENYQLESWCYLLIGIPLAFGFQRIVRREKLGNIWLRNHAAWPWTKTGWLFAACLALAPAFAVFKGVSQGEWLKSGMLLISVAGAAACGFAIHDAFRNPPGKKNLTIFLVELVLLGAIGYFWGRGGAVTITASSETFFVLFRLLAINLGAAMIIEDGIFRGIVDSHLHPSGSNRYLTTAVVSALLWGVWHLPLFLFQGVAPAQLGRLSVTIVITCLIIGVMFSDLWRRTGNLAFVVIPHAVVDAIGNYYAGIDY